MEKISISIAKPFGPTIAKVTIPEDMILKLNNYIDELITAFDDLDIDKNGLTSVLLITLLNILVIAKTQSGKTGAMIAICKEYKTYHNIPIEHIYMITGHSSTAWKKQTKKKKKSGTHFKRDTPTGSLSHGTASQGTCLGAQPGEPLTRSPSRPTEHLA